MSEKLPKLNIGSTSIDVSSPCYVIAEIGVNHNGRAETAIDMIDAAAAAGADAAKFQTFHTESVVSADAPMAQYQHQAGRNATTQHDLIRGLELSEKDFVSLKMHCDEIGIDFLSTPFDRQSLDFLRRLGVPALKVASGEVTNIPLIEAIGATGLPVLLSTGMSTLDEVDQAVHCLIDSGSGEIAVLQCTSAYPSRPEDANLMVLPVYAERYGTIVGLSDHTPGITTAIGAVALGAKIVEKHFTLDRQMTGPDHAASLDPNGFTGLVREIRNIEKALGTGEKRPLEVEQDVRRVARRSLFIAKAVSAGTEIKESDLVALRPGTGISPARLDEFVGRRAMVDLAEGALLDEGAVADGTN